MTTSDLLRLAKRAGVEAAREQQPRPPEVVRIVGTCGGRRVSLIRERSGDAVYPAVKTDLDPALDLGLDARPSSLMRTPLSGILHLHLDQEYAIGFDDHRRARKLFGNTLADRMYALHCGCMSPTLTDAQVTIFDDWSKASVGAVVELADLVDATRESVPLPESLVVHAEAWSRLAARVGTTLKRTPLRLSGSFEQLALDVRACRTGQDQYQLDLFLRLPEPLGAKLGITPTRTFVDPIAVWFGGQDVRVGDPVFDEAFRIQVDLEHESALVRALDQGTRALLLGARSHGAALLLADDGLRARFAAGGRPEALPSTVEPLAEAMRRIERALRLRGRAESPYRS